MIGFHARIIAQMNGCRKSGTGRDRMAESFRGRKGIIIGGGASGLMAAITAAKQGADVTVLEHTARPGKRSCQRETASAT